MKTSENCQNEIQYSFHWQPQHPCLSYSYIRRGTRKVEVTFPHVKKMPSKT